MSGLFFQRKALLAKLEGGGYGVDATPTGASNAILANNVSITPIEAALLERNVVLPYFGSVGKIPGGAFVKLDFQVEIAGAGNVGAIPAYDALLKAAGKIATNNASAGIVYNPKAPGDAADSVSVYFYLDGVLHKVTGTVGNVALDFNHEALPQYKFTMTGVFNPVADAPLPSVTLSTVKPVPVNKTNTQFSLHSYAAVLAKLHLDSGNVVDAKDYANSAQQVRISDRKGVGSVSMEAALVATKDWFGIARAGTIGALSITHGVTPGNTVIVTCPAVQLENPKYGNANGIALLDAGLLLLPSAGNDEMTITVV